MPAATSDEYAEHLAETARLNFAVGKDADISHLLFALGCKELVRDARANANIWVSSSPPQPDAKHEVLVVEYLLKTLRWNGAQFSPSDEHGFALLDGFLKNGRWRAVLDNVDDAYALADILWLAAEMMTRESLHNGYLNIFVRDIVPTALALLNIWAAPQAKIEQPFTMDLVRRTLFGDAFCDLHAHDDSDLSGIFLANRLPRAPFLPGLVPAQVEIAAIALPDMDGP